MGRRPGIIGFLLGGGIARNALETGMKMWKLGSLCLLLCLLSACGERSSKVEVERTGLRIDYPTLWKVCNDVAMYRSGMDIEESNIDEGYILTEWRIEEGYNPSGTAKRKRVEIEIEPEKESQGRTFTVRLTVEAQESKGLHQLGDIDGIRWTRAREDEATRKWLLQVIENRVNSILENRRLGLPDPEFHDIRVGE